MPLESGGLRLGSPAHGERHRAAAGADVESLRHPVRV